MKYKMIVSDFDGTLLDSGQNISQRSRRAIKAYTDAGGVFTVSTGRMYSSIIQRVPDLGLDGLSIPVMSFQGALVTDSATKEHIYKVPMDRSLVIEIAELAKSKGVYCHAYSTDKIYIGKKCEISRLYCEYSRVENDAVYVGDLAAYFSHNDIETVKALIIDAPATLDALCDEVNGYFNGRVVFVRSADNLIECVDKNAGKGNTVRYVASRLGIGMDEVIAVGDTMNDYSMIAAAGLGVAMQNADIRLKAAADKITDTNDGDGVAKIIEAALKNEL
jgi:Cof subfamily protein (haloacid dehalogenase superfamily)